MNLAELRPLASVQLAGEAILVFAKICAAITTISCYGVRGSPLSSWRKPAASRLFMAPIATKKKKVGPVRSRRVWLERRAFELSKDCPALHANPKDCPLFGLRPLPASERKAWIHQLTHEELEYLATYHSCCYAEKTAGCRR
jgi:hypothetical protein